MRHFNPYNKDFNEFNAVGIPVEAARAPDAGRSGHPLPDREPGRHPVCRRPSARVRGAARDSQVRSEADSSNPHRSGDRQGHRSVARQAPRSARYLPSRKSAGPTSRARGGGESSRSARSRTSSLRTRRISTWPRPCSFWRQTHAGSRRAGANAGSNRSSASRRSCGANSTERRTRNTPSRF